MRLAGTVAAIAIMTTPASAEVFQVQQGTCMDWQGTWDVNRDANGNFRGSVELTHVGGSCAGRTNAVRTGQISGRVYPNGSFDARESSMTDGNNCSFTGTVVNRNASGSHTCSGGGGPWSYRVTIP